MNKKLTRVLMTAMALTQLSGAVLTPVTAVFAESSYSLTNSATSRLNETKSAVSKMENSTNKDTIKAAMTSFSKVFGNGDTQGNAALEYNGHAKGLFDKIIKALNKQGGGVKNELTLSFYNQMGLRYGNDNNFYYGDYLTALIDNTTDANLKLKLRHSAGVLNRTLVHYETMEKDSKGNKVIIKDGNVTEAVPVTIDPSLLEKRPAETVAIDLETNPDLIEGEAVEFDGSWEDVYYEFVDGKHIRVTTTYYEKDGKITSQVKREVVPEHEALGGTAEDWALMSKVTSETIDDIRRTDIGEEAPAQMEKSGFTLHYTVTKGEANAYYYDTGIRVSDDETATYQQVKDVLYQLALRAEGYLAEDEGKFLIVVEGKPVLIRESKDKYTKEEVENFFNGFEQADMRVMPTRIGTTASLEEQLATGTTQKVEVNGKEASLATQPSVEDNYVILPIEEIAGLLGLKVSQNGTKLVVSKADKTVTYENGVKAVVVNESVVDTAVSSKESDGVLMGDISPLNDAFDITMVWDEEESTILLMTPDQNQKDAD